MNIKESTFTKRAPMWEIQAWTKLLQGQDGWKNPTYKRLDLLQQPQLLALYMNVTGAPPLETDKDSLRVECQRLAETMLPVDETSIDELRQMLLAKKEEDNPDMNYGEDKRLFLAFRTAAETIQPPVAVISVELWRSEGRPTAEEYYGVTTNQPKGGPTHPINEGDTMSAENTTATETAPAPAAAPTATPAETKPAKAPRPPGAKVLVRQLFATPGQSLTLEEIAKATGKPTSSITTAISDLRSSKYCKPGDPMVLYRHDDGKYSLTQPPPKVEEAAQQPAATPGAPPAEDVLPQA